MYAVRVMLGGDIFIVRVSDNTRARYKADGTPVWGSHNKLGFDPYQVLEFAREAESEWLAKYIRD